MTDKVHQHSDLTEASILGGLSLPSANSKSLMCARQTGRHDSAEDPKRRLS